MSVLFDWVRGFNARENWGDAFRMNGMVVILLDRLREVYRKRYDEHASFVIHSGFATSGHAPLSQHYKGNAIDFHINSTLSFVAQHKAVLAILTDLQVSQYIGFGIYPDWNSPGFHIDVRGVFARWGFIGKSQVSIEATMKHAEEKESA